MCNRPPCQGRLDHPVADRDGDSPAQLPQGANRAEDVVDPWQLVFGMNEESGIDLPF